MKRIIVIALSFICICGCQPRINSRGNITLAEKIDTFVVGKTKTADVYNACGTPSLQRGDRIWIYIGAKSEEIAFRDVEMKDKLVARLTFDDKGILRNIEKVSEDKAKSEVDSEVTELLKK